MKDKIYDMFGNPIKEGESLIMAFPESNAAVLRVGKITGFRESTTKRYQWDETLNRSVKKDYLLEKVVVEWDADQSPSWVPDKPSLLECKTVESRTLKMVADATV